MLTKADRILIIIILIFSIIISLYFYEKTKNIYEKVAIIQVDGENYRDIDLSSDVKTSFEVTSNYGKNLIEVDGNRIRVIDASCPDKLDVKQGWISKPGEIIVCLPNRLTIEVKGNYTGDGPDKISR